MHRALREEVDAMLCIEIDFVAGRYHATPWGRHVNEGDAAWPPEPWRLVRALLAVWHAKIKHRDDVDDALLESLILRLTERPPHYQVPRAVRAHSRHYLPTVKGGKYDTTLVLDAFARVEPGRPLRVGWPDLDLTEAQQRLLDDLLAGLSYLGRAESWVAARRGKRSFEPNSWPLLDTSDTAVDDRYEIVELLAPVSPETYAERRAQLLPDLKKSFRGKKRREVEQSLPERFIKALEVETSTLQKACWTQPPAAEWVRYARPTDIFQVQRRLRPAPAARQAHSALFVLTGKPLPKVEQTLRIAELVRAATLKAGTAAESAIPALLSGHDLPPDHPPHQHAFYLPIDRDRDGFLDHLLVHVPGGIDTQSQQILGRLRRLYDRHGNEWHVMLAGFDPPPGLLPWTAEATHWRSTTPYLHPWHRKKRFDIPDQIRRECQMRGLPEPEHIERLQHIPAGGRTRRPVHFERTRLKQNLRQPDRHGSFWRIVFPEPIRGPLALGFACHFGLGLFIAEPGARNLTGSSITAR